MNPTTGSSSTNTDLLFIMSAIAIVGAIVVFRYRSRIAAVTFGSMSRLFGDVIPQRAIRIWPSSSRSASVALGVLLFVSAVIAAVASGRI